MTKSAELVEQLRLIADRLQAAAVWNGSLANVDTDSNDYVYELLCYFQIVLAAKVTFSPTISGAIGKNSKGQSMALWPRNPGDKVNFSFVVLTPILNQGDGFQLCPGINITDTHGKDRAPDINLLSHDAPLTPDWSSLRGCWDAKFTKNSKKRLPDTAVSDFSYTYQHLGSPKPPSRWTSMGHKEFEKSGLLTNGQMSTERDSALMQTGISETSTYPIAPTTRP